MTVQTPRDLLDDFALCLGFYTRLPVPGARTERSFAAAQWAAPLTGLAVGLCGGVALLAALWLGLSAWFAAALALAATMLATGALHEDGLADVADGFGGGATRERKLEIMRDSRIGTYGALALLLSALLRWSALAMLAAPRPAEALGALLAAEAASRALIPWFMRALPTARPDGLAAGVGEVPDASANAALLLGIVLLILLLGPERAALAALLLALVFFGLRRLARRQIGGHTGDVLGALQQVSAIAVLAAACSGFS